MSAYLRVRSCVYMCEGEYVIEHYAMYGGGEEWLLVRTSVSYMALVSIEPSHLSLFTVKAVLGCN